MKHNKTPWKIDGSKGVDLFGNKFSTLGIKDAKTDRFLALLGENAKANAAFITRACNTHDELLAALVRAIEAAGFSVSGPTNPDVAEDEGEPRWVAFARQAIARAEGK